MKKKSTPIGYLFSRYAVPSQTFCDSEILGLEEIGQPVVIASANPPSISFRHERLANLKAPVIYPPPGYVLKEILEDEEFKKISSRKIERHLSQYGESFKPELRAAHAWWIAQGFKKRGVEHVHIHFANRATHVALFLKELGITFSFTAHAQDFMVDLGNDELLTEMISESEFVIGVSDFSAELLKKISPENESKISRLYNGIYLDQFSNPEEKKKQNDVLKIVSIGRLIPFKGFDLLIDALSILKNKGVKFQLEIVGDGPEEANLKERVSSHGLENVVVFKGLQSQMQIQKLLANASVFALACRIDNKGASDILPTVITEAMASRLPVVSTRVAGVPEMVLDGETGFVTEPDDAEAFAEALEKIAISKELMLKLGEAGRDHAENNFNIKHTVKLLADRFASFDIGNSESETNQKKILYLVESKNLNNLHVGLTNDHDIELCVCGEGKAKELVNVSRLPLYLPDAIALESYWLGEEELRKKCETLRAEIGKSVFGENYFREARRAVYLTKLFQESEVQSICVDSSSLLNLGSILSKLIGAKLVGKIENEPAIGRSVIQKIYPQYDWLSIEDSLLRTRLGLENNTASKKSGVSKWFSSKEENKYCFLDFIKEVKEASLT